MDTQFSAVERLARFMPGSRLGEGHTDDHGHFQTLNMADGNVLLDRSVMRAASPYSQATGLIDHLVTTIVAGQVGQNETWVDRVFRPIIPTDDRGPVNGSAFSYLRFGNQHLAEMSLKLPDGAPYKFIKHGQVKVSSQLELYGVASYQTLRTLRDSPAALNLDVRTQLLVARAVSMALQADARDAMTTTANYATVATLAGGDEWTDASGDPKANVQAGINAIISAVGGQPTDIRIELPMDSYFALRNNAAFIEDRKYTVASSADIAATLVLMRDFLGVGEVNILSPRSEVAGTVDQMFGDDVFMYSMGNETAEFTTDYGRELWGVRFAFNDGVAEQPWDDRLSRAKIYAFNREWRLHVVHTGAGYLIRNTVA
jgi:hypothetical protein